MTVRLQVRVEVGVAVISSFVTFALGAAVPLLPFLLGFTSLVAGLAVGGLGRFIAGALASLATGMRGG